MMPTARLLAIIILCLCSCAFGGALHTWNPDRAASDAEHDIAAGNIRFAYIGGRASYPPGLPDGSYATVRRYEHLDVGPQGCNQGNTFDVRKEYARRYNARMWAYVSSHAHHLTNRSSQPPAVLMFSFLMNSAFNSVAKLALASGG